MSGTSVGKKELAMPMPSSFDPQYVEKDWMPWWEERGYFSPLGKNGTTLQQVGRRDDEDIRTACAKYAGTLTPERKFVMVIPPPNVTGSLHIGHALTVTIEDALCRWNRMCGKAVLWVPGVDHAGIATQSVVERMLLREENKSRHDLGREAFISKVWEWKEKYGNTITNQLRSVGSSVSWPHFAFTLDNKLSRAVVEAFIRLFNRGLIYREQRLVSWSPFLKTALSDIEVDTDEIDKPQKIRVPGFEYPVEVGYLWHFIYPVEGGGEIEVATTRIETMLGDTAVAVNPKDERYKHLVGKRILHPFFPERDIKVIADEYVDMEFGTGAVKITPAHDKNDYEIGKRHNLDFITVYTLDGHINELGGEFAGQHRFACRFNIQNRLKELGLLRDKVPNTKPMQLPKCSRSGDIIEYMLVPQWWMDCKDAGARSVEAVRRGELVIKPESSVSTWEYWLGNIQDWCISRQLWWGHRIPAYRVVHPHIPPERCNMGDEAWVAAHNIEEAKDIACRLFEISNPDDIALEQDPDVLDTWFSSGLFPFSVFGWPDDTDELKAFFPTTLLETGHDILFFWVARMVMMSLLLLDKLPFRTVYLHPMVRDAQGQKMSKSKGNVIDPLEIINGISLDGLVSKLHQGNLPEKEIKRSEALLRKDFKDGIPACGCDALRMGLAAYLRQGRNINLDLKRVVGYRQFANKIWNCFKLAMDKWNLDVDGTGKSFSPCGIDLITSANQQKGGKGPVPYSELLFADKWILHRLSEASDQANRGFESYDLSEVVTAVYNFWLYDLCDVYLESIKPRLQAFPSFKDRPADEVASRQSDARHAQEVLFVCIDRGLRLLHPICPFVTEELYQRLPPSLTKAESICISDYPQPSKAWTDPELERGMQKLMQLVSRFRSLLAALEVTPKLRPCGYVLVRDEDPKQLALITENKTIIAMLAKMEKVSVVTDAPSARCVSDVVTPSLTVYLEVSEGVNIRQTLTKLEDKRANLEKMIDGYRKKELDPNYSKTPEDVRVANATKKANYEKELQLLVDAIKNIEPLLN